MSEFTILVHQDTEGTVVNRVFRATHYLPEEVLQLR